MSGVLTPAVIVASRSLARSSQATWSVLTSVAVRGFVSLRQGAHATCIASVAMLTAGVIGVFRFISHLTRTSRVAGANALVTAIGTSRSLLNRPQARWVVGLGVLVAIVVSVLIRGSYDSIRTTVEPRTESAATVPELPRVDRALVVEPRVVTPPLAVPASVQAAVSAAQEPIVPLAPAVQNHRLVEPAVPVQKQTPRPPRTDQTTLPAAAANTRSAPLVPRLRSSAVMATRVAKPRIIARVAVA